MNGIVSYVSDPAHWSGEDGLAHRLLQHLEYSLAALVIAVAIGLPLGLFVGHTGRGAVWIPGVVNAARGLPTFGLLVLAVLVLSDSLSGDLTYLLPSLLVLVVLGVPAVLSATYAGVRSVDPAARDAARGMGMTGGQVLRQVEVPIALPLILSGVRSACLQIVATATIAAYVSLGGLGRLIIDGQQQRDYPQMLTGAAFVALLALALDLTFALAQRLVVRRG